MIWGSSHWRGDTERWVCISPRLKKSFGFYLISIEICLTSIKQRLEQFAYTLAVIWRTNCRGEVWTHRDELESYSNRRERAWTLWGTQDGRLSESGLRPSICRTWPQSDADVANSEEGSKGNLNDVWMNLLLTKSKVRIRMRKIGYWSRGKMNLVLDTELGMIPHPSGIHRRFFGIWFCAYKRARDGIQSWWPPMT